MSDTFDLKITISTPKSTGGEAEETRGSLHFDDKELEKFSIMSGETRTIESKVEVEDGDHEIKVKHLFSASPSSALIIDQIEMDEINIGVISYQGEYRPTYPEPWYGDESTAGRTPKEVIGRGDDGSACLYMGWEGNYTLKFSTPLYEWLLEHL